MITLTDGEITLGTLEREHCRTIWSDAEYDETNPCEPLRIGYSVEKADEWFEEIQRLQGKQNVRLGVFLDGGAVIGDAALQDIDWYNQCCSIGMGIAKLQYRGKGYGRRATALLLRYAFSDLGLHRVTATTLQPNVAAQRSLLACGFVLEGTERKAVYLRGTWVDRLCYAVLREEYPAAGKI